MRISVKSWLIVLLLIGFIGQKIVIQRNMPQLMVSTVSAETPSPPEKSVEEWMNDWMRSRTKAVAGALHLQRFKDPIYIITKPIAWKPNSGQESFPEVNVPKGFVSDFASIPSIFWSRLRPDGEYTYPAIIHDYLYWVQDPAIPRKQADMIFKLAMKDFGINPFLIGLIHTAVRATGSLAWIENAEKKANGEKRILRRFPENPTVSWDDWKNERNVFRK